MIIDWRTCIKKIYFLEPTSSHVFQNDHVYWNYTCFLRQVCWDTLFSQEKPLLLGYIFLSKNGLFLGHIRFFWRNNYVYWDKPVFKKWSCLLGHICFSWNDHVYWYIFTVIMLIGRHLFLNKLPFLGHLFIKKIFI